jgi:hypothetical protein
MNSFRSSSALTFSLLAVLLLTPALAQAQKRSSRGLVTAEDIAKHPSDPIERIIARYVTGVEVVRTPGGGNMLRIRGAMTLPDAESGMQVDKAPLYVVDGVPIRNADGSLPPIDAQDVDSVRVLKGSEAGAFGIEGADGVIVFTTKRGKVRKN